MDTGQVLEVIHKNLDSSAEEARVRYETIFIEFQRLLFSKGGVEANEYLALHMGEISYDFQLYFVAFSGELRNEGKPEAAEALDRVLKSFIESYKHFEVTKARALANSAAKLASNFIGELNNFKKE